MPTYLMTWNSKKKPETWPEMKRYVERVALGDKPTMKWPCGHSKTIKKGDRLILFRQGEEPRGVIGTATAIRDWFESEIGGPKQPSRTKNSVEIEIETLIDPTIDDPLIITEMEAGGIRGVNWSSQESGTRVDDVAANSILRMWLPRSNVPKEIDELSGIEGEVALRLVRHRKRERRLRDAAIKQAMLRPQGLTCDVPRCKFNFIDRYGEKGRGFAHVHHLGKLADRSRPSETQLSDLAIVCANCHVMIHLGGENRDMDTLIPKSNGDV